MSEFNEGVFVLKTKDSVGFNKMNSNLLRTCIAELIDPILFGTVLIQKHFPWKVKIAKVTEICKANHFTSIGKLQTYFCIIIFCKDAGENNR